MQLSDVLGSIGDKYQGFDPIESLSELLAPIEQSRAPSYQFSSEILTATVFDDTGIYSDIEKAVAKSMLLRMLLASPIDDIVISLGINDIHPSDVAVIDQAGIRSEVRELVQLDLEQNPDQKNRVQQLLDLL